MKIFPSYNSVMFGLSVLHQGLTQRAVPVQYYTIELNRELFVYLFFFCLQTVVDVYTSELENMFPHCHNNLYTVYGHFQYFENEMKAMRFRD